jgi:Fe-S-cluster containining protein
LIQVADMLIFLRSDYLAHGMKTGVLVHHYTCKNFDGLNCRIYEQRPKMCSGYPYGNACRYSKCTCMKYKYPHAKDVAGTRVIAEVLECDIT